MRSSDSSSTGEAWDAIQRLRSSDPTERNEATRAMGPPSRLRPALLRFARTPYEAWRGDVDSNLGAALLPFTRGAAQYPFRSVVFMEGQESVGVWLLCTGTVRLTRSSAAGKNVTLYIAHAGALLGLSAVIARDSLRMAAQTAQACTLAFLDREHLFRLMADPEIAHLVTEALGRELQARYSSSGDLMLARSARSRVARVLLSVAPGDLHSHLQLSELASCSRETVTRLLGDLQRDGLIAYDRGEMRLLDEAGIQALCE